MNEGGDGRRWRRRVGDEIYNYIRNKKKHIILCFIEIIKSAWKLLPFLCNCAGK